MRLAEKFAVVTGGSDGIGYGIAAAFADNGAEVCIVARDPSELSGAWRRQVGG